MPSAVYTQHEEGESALANCSAVIETPETSTSRLAKLLEENGEDDYGALGPSQLAFYAALKLVDEAERMIKGKVISSPVVDSQGGIRITWRNGDRQVKLVCPATNETPVHIYRSSPLRNLLQNANITAAVLADNLSWLKDREPAASESDPG
jgi:hypothetical protein